MNLQKRNSNNARIWILRPQRCISSLSFFATLALFNLYFVFPILYYVFCIVYFLFCIFASPQVIFLLHWISQSEGRGRASLQCCIYCSYCFSTSHILSHVAMYIMAGGGYCSSSAIDFALKSAMFSLPSCIVGSYRAVQPVSSHQAQPSLLLSLFA